jgi:AraC-like DNA-binding protein
MDGAEERELVGPVAWWTWPGPQFRYGCHKPPGWNHYFVTFSGKWVDGLLKTGWLDTQTAEPYREVADPEVFRDRMRILHASLAERDEMASWAALLALLCELRKERATGSRGEDAHSAGLRALLTEIRAAPGQAWEVEDVAKGLHLSSSHFRRLFRAETGIPFRQFCLRCRMDYAARLLRKGNAPLKVVAESCGVSDEYQGKGVCPKAPIKTGET